MLVINNLPGELMTSPREGTILEKKIIYSGHFHINQLSLKQK